MTGIILSHPTQNFKAIIYGISEEKLRKLAELRILKGSVKKRYRTIKFNQVSDLYRKAKYNGMSELGITDEDYEREVKSYFLL